MGTEVLMHLQKPDSNHDWVSDSSGVPRDLALCRNQHQVFPCASWFLRTASINEGNLNLKQGGDFSLYDPNPPIIWLDFVWPPHPVASARQ